MYQYEIDMFVLIMLSFYHASYFITVYSQGCFFIEESWSFSHSSFIFCNIDMNRPQRKEGIYSSHFDNDDM